MVAKASAVELPRGCRVQNCREAASVGYEADSALDSMLDRPHECLPERLRSWRNDLVSARLLRAKLLAILRASCYVSRLLTRAEEVVVPWGSYCRQDAS